MEETTRVCKKPDIQEPLQGGDAEKEERASPGVLRGVLAQGWDSLRGSGTCLPCTQPALVQSPALHMVPHAPPGVNREHLQVWDRNKRRSTAHPCPCRGGQPRAHLSLRPSLEHAWPEHPPPPSLEKGLGASHRLFPEEWGGDRGALFIIRSAPTCAEHPARWLSARTAKQAQALHVTGLP